MHEIIKTKLEILESDVSSQYNALLTKKDVYWDCYDLDNWRAMHDSIIVLSKALGIEIENNLIVDGEE